MNHPDLQPNQDGGFIVFSPSQARDLAESLLRHADLAAAPRQFHHESVLCGSPLFGSVATAAFGLAMRNSQKGDERGIWFEFNGFKVTITR